ncbi:MAG TPA: 2-oxoacid:acceptor oxidoreductase subunit alpha [bacterium]|nr:2-oxoacid:acceptor oxidoreductase subunit alpha [bacterium]HMZ04976.1 2-oxoacid:acceptor oxidoreductase subunit alpha [bacterium]HNB09047.1 2-oxoacid:acceptor oxidoreductase subunit alpha [bacterium]HND77697.1 2-oxoacid:acceptor oxidoreductase subunit alpha [bacterium]HNF86606.1 2-oxoacid:acceptor oxidoreductase subunit alpha [bacterium]
MAAESVLNLDEVTIRLAGDSGDGMQLVGTELTNASALLGNDVGTLPDYPAEIRAPAGTLPGVSGFQLHIGSFDIHTPGDEVDVLVAMNPAALKANIRSLKPNGVLIVNAESFGERDLKLANCATNPLEDGTVDGYQLFRVDMSSHTKAALKDTGLDHKSMERCKNFFSLGMIAWLYNRPMDGTIKFLKEKFAKKPLLAESNILAMKAGYAYCEATEAFANSYEIPPAKLPVGKYRNISGNEAIALGFVAASQKSGLELFLGSYPITPASDILHGLAKYKNFGVKTFQAEDEIAAICAAIGASFAGELGITSTSGPGVCLKSEAIGLAVMTELPLVVINVQRAGPSTGLPTKTEQSDLLQAMFGRNGESPVPIIAASRPADCFECAYEAARIAVKYMTPVFLLADGYIGNGAEPWLIPDSDKLNEFSAHRTFTGEKFTPYARDEKTLARPWIVPGTPGFEHRIGGLEKKNIAGTVNYEPENHDYMVRIRGEKVKRIAQEWNPLSIDGPDSGDLLVIGWGGTYGAIRTAVDRSREKGLSVSRIHLRWINPFPQDLDAILKRFKHVLIPEINLGQLRMLIRAEYLVDAIGLNKVTGQPFSVREIENKITEILKK